MQYLVLEWGEKPNDVGDWAVRVVSQRYRAKQFWNPGRYLGGTDRFYSKSARMLIGSRFCPQFCDRSRGGKHAGEPVLYVRGDDFDSDNKIAYIPARLRKRVEQAVAEYNKARAAREPKVQLALGLGEKGGAA